MDASLISWHHLRSCNKYSPEPSILRRKMEAFIYRYSSPVHQKISPGLINILPHLDCMDLKKGIVILRHEADCDPCKIGCCRWKKKNRQVRQNHSGAKAVSDMIHICTAQTCSVQVKSNLYLRHTKNGSSKIFKDLMQESYWNKL